MRLLCTVGRCQVSLLSAFRVDRDKYTVIGRTNETAVAAAERGKTCLEIRIPAPAVPSVVVPPVAVSTVSRVCYASDEIGYVTFCPDACPWSHAKPALGDTRAQRCLCVRVPTAPMPFVRQASFFFVGNVFNIVLADFVRRACFRYTYPRDRFSFISNSPNNNVPARLSPRRRRQAKNPDTAPPPPLVPAPNLSGFARFMPPRHPPPHQHRMASYPLPRRRRPPESTATTAAISRQRLPQAARAELAGRAVGAEAQRQSASGRRPRTAGKRKERRRRRRQRQRRPEAQ